jgi:crossover junction endodeoxyribonuclease RuvC
MTHARYIGVDPGLSGAIAFMAEDGALIAVFDMPITPVKTKSGKKQNVVTAPVLANLIRHHCTGGAPVSAFLEHVHALPGQGTVSMFNFGMSYGIVRGVFGALDIPFEIITPRTWQKLACVQGKEGSRTKAGMIYPSFASMFRRKMDDGRADAVLIAYAGRKSNLIDTPFA